MKELSIFILNYSRIEEIFVLLLHKICFDTEFMQFKMKLFSRLFNGNAPTFYVSLPTLQTTTCRHCQEKNHKQETRKAGHEEIKIHSPLKTRSQCRMCFVIILRGSRGLITCKTFSIIDFCRIILQ